MTTTGTPAAHVAADAPRVERERAAMVLLAAALDELGRLLPDWTARDVSRAAVAAWETRRRKPRRSPPAPPPPMSEADLDAAVLAAVREVDVRDRCGGVVPLPMLRAELPRRDVHADRAAVDAAIIRLERAYAIDCCIAQSPNTVPDRAAGIERPGRGLIYYLAPRTDGARPAEGG